MHGGYNVEFNQIQIWRPFCHKTQDFTVEGNWEVDLCCLVMGML
jgi:hypothetical protein